MNEYDINTMELLQKAFEYAEQETANYYEGRSCGVMDKEGKHSCPICYFRKQVKDYIIKYKDPKPK